MHNFWLILVVVICALCLPAVAAGQERARPDPDSPAGVEYKLPLDQARDDAAGEGKGRGEAEGREDPPLFGSGITESPSKSGADASGRSVPVTGKRTSGEARTRQGRVAAAPATSEGGSGASVPLIAAAVLFVGGALGLGLRRGIALTHRP